MYIFVSSHDSKTYYPSNTGWDFRVELPVPIKEAHLYEIALTHVFYPYQLGIENQYFYIFCDIVEESIVNGSKHQILGSFFQIGSIETPQYLPIIKDPLHRIHCFIKHSDLTEPAITHLPIFFTLHLKKKT